MTFDDYHDPEWLRFHVTACPTMWCSLWLSGARMDLELGRATYDDLLARQAAWWTA